MHPINVLIKPASGNCNLRCNYCFYHDEVANRDAGFFGMMKKDTIEPIIQKVLAAASGNCTFGFQGGEPTLAGLEFFRTVIALQKKYNYKKLKIHNALQTNGTLLDRDWASFFTENRFLVGVSLDGYESLHNLYRKDASGNGTFSCIMRGIEELKRARVEFNILTVVTAQTAKHIQDVYAFFMKNGLVYQQYITCLDPIGEKRGSMRYSLTPQLYGRFLKDLFDMWYKDRSEGKFVYIRYFENLAGMMLGHRPESCDMNGVCSVQYAFEADGSVYPCDFYMLDGFNIGNIHEDSIETIDQNRMGTGFIQQSACMPEQCQSCRWLCLCHGGCRRNRMQNGLNDISLNYYCNAYKEFFPYAIPRMATLIGMAPNAKVNG